MLDPINDRETLLCLEAERGFLSRLHADCNFPVGVLANDEQRENESSRAGVLEEYQRRREKRKWKASLARARHWRQTIRSNYETVLRKARVRA